MLYDIISDRMIHSFRSKLCKLLYDAGYLNRGFMRLISMQLPHFFTSTSTILIPSQHWGVRKKFAANQTCIVMITNIIVYYFRSHNN